MIFIATIKEIAKACNVSISTVSNILNGKNKASDEVKKLVLETAKEMNYVPNYMAKNLKQKNTKTIGIIAEDLTIFHTPSIIDGISEFMEEKGYTLLMGNMRLYQKYGNFFYKEKNYDSLVEDEVQQMRNAYNQRRRYLVNEFAKMKLECFEPFGAFYIFPSIKEFGMTSEEFAMRFLEEEKVAVVPGSAFGESGEGFLRVSYAYSLEDLKEAIGRLSRFVERLRSQK